MFWSPAANLSSNIYLFHGPITTHMQHSPRFQRHRVLEVEHDADILGAALEEQRVLRNQRPDDLLDAVQLV